MAREQSSQDAPTVVGEAGAPPTIALLLLFFSSGAAALVYEVLWLKELGRLFGVTAHAAATTLAVFFLGLAAGSLTWGRRAARVRHPLRTYAWLELAIAVSALLYFGLLDLYRWLYPGLFAAIGDSPWLFLTVKFLLAVGILFPPAFFMGGTLPVMGEFLIRRASELGRTATVLYAVNTLGAATGALAAGFYLPRALGFRGSYAAAMALNVVVALIAIAWSRGEWRGRASPDDAAAPAAERPTLEVRAGMIWLLAAASGFLTLALEVLWTRMFSQVLQNSVYTFAAILTVFLVALALGSVLAYFLTRVGWSPRSVLFGLLACSGAGVGLTPALFLRLNEGLGYLGGGLGWTGYVVAVFSGTAAVLLVPGLLIGGVFPYLMKISEPIMATAGRTIGQLASANTLAAILGSLAAGFVLLDWIGLWASLRLVAAAYLVLALAVLPAGRRGRLAGALPVAGLVVLFTALDPGELLSLSTGRGEEVVYLREGAQGTVAVVRRGDDLRLKVNNHYLLGTVLSTPNQRIQAWLPLALHPRPQRVFFLGMGTGITAAGALHYPVERVVVTEVNPQVVEAARTQFGPYLNGLFADPRARVLATDGRTYLAGTSETFDVIIGDIFLTYRAGVGSLYTREHFETVRSRLEPGGIFAQWLPLFDLSPHEFGIVTRTMLEVFPQVTLWRRGFSPVFPVFALVASEPAELDAAALRAGLGRLAAQGVASPDLWFENIPLAAYAGNPSAARSQYRGYPVSTDDRSPLEYLAPITERNSRWAGAGLTLAWDRLPGFCDRLLHAVPLDEDPYLAGLRQRDRYEIEAGLAYQRYEADRRAGHSAAAQGALWHYRQLVAAALGPPEASADGDDGPPDAERGGS